MNATTARIECVGSLMMQSATRVSIHIKRDGLGGISGLPGQRYELREVFGGTGGEVKLGSRMRVHGAPNLTNNRYMDQRNRCELAKDQSWF